MKKLLIIPFLLISLILSASPIGINRAKMVAIQFFAENQTRSVADTDVDLAWAGYEMVDGSLTKGVASDVDEALLYIFNCKESESFVVIAGDDKVAPIVAFSHDNSFDYENMADGTRAILNGWCKQIEAARNSDSKVVYGAVPNSTGNVVKSYTTALWDQGEPYNREAPVYNGERCVTGCVATAMSILAYYYKWPEQGIGVTPEYTYEEYGETYTVPANTLGRTYQYTAMLSDYSDGYTKAQGDAVAALMKDMGTSVKMMYGVSESGAYDRNVPIALTTYFGFSKAMQLVTHTGYSEDEWVVLLQNNLNSCGPMYFSGQSISGGHAFVLDGYTDEDYFRINFGWGGSNNGYYLLPDSPYYEGQMSILGGVPDEAGTSSYSDYLTMITSEENGLTGLVSFAEQYQTDTPFNISFGGVHNEGLVPFTGVIAVALCDKDGEVKEVLKEFDRSEKALNVRYYTWYKDYTVTINESIELGDRLRICYRTGSSEWSWVRKGYEDAIDELIIAAPPADVSKTIDLGYNKDTKELSFNSSLTLHYELKDATNATLKTGDVTSYKEEVLDFSALASGTYTISFSANGEPYVLTIKL